jgi:hypothetical protein
VGWFWDEAVKWEWWALRVQFIVLALSSLVTVAAAVPLVFNSNWAKLGVVALSALTTFVSGLLSKAGIERTAQLREEGRTRVQALKEKANIKLAMPMPDNELASYLDWLVERIEEIELKFGIGPLVASRSIRQEPDGADGHRPAKGRSGGAGERDRASVPPAIRAAGGAPPHPGQ